MSSKESESYRIEMLRRLEQENRNPPPSEIAEAEKVIADYRAKQAQAREAMPRLREPLPESDLCPMCWYPHGIKSTMRPTTGPDTKHFDYWKCGKCPYEEKRAFGI